MVDMVEKENFSFDSLFLLIDLSFKNSDQKFSLKTLKKIDLIDKVDIDFQKIEISEGEFIVLKCFDNEHLSGLILKVLKKENVGERVLRLFVSPVDYVKIIKVIDYNNYKKVKCEKVYFKEIKDENLSEAYLNLLKKNFKELSNYNNTYYDSLYKINSEKDLFLLSEELISLIDLDKQSFNSFILETDVETRIKNLLVFISQEIEKKKIEKRIYDEVIEKSKEDARKSFLKEQLRIINRELGYSFEQEDEFSKIKNKILKSDLTEHAKEKALEEANRLKSLTTYSPEYNIIKNYLDWLLSLPWKKMTQDNFDIKLAKKILTKNHYGLTQVKERILEYLSVLKLSKDSKGHILCFVGAPGVGKTSLGQSIAEAMGRKFVRISLGGIKDESEIKGHRRTYVGAMPGRIIQMMKRAGVINPVFMLDEIDKLGGDYRGDPSNAFLEILDPQINNSFSDNYLELEYDLSKVLFICTANVVHTIPPALRDRMEIIEIPGYLEFEKVEISKKFLIPRMMKRSGLRKNDIQFENEALVKIIRNYSPEAGIRGLEKNIQAIMGKRAKEIAIGEKIKNKKIGKEEVVKYLGPELYIERTKEKRNIPGIVNGLAWTPNGGKVLTVETVILEGNGNVQLTGQIGDVMKESAATAISYLRKNYKLFDIDPEFYKKFDTHIHIPEGAIPKDGPSAGITLVVSLISALTKKPVKGGFAMTGEITLTGNVLPVGGLFEKIVAAQIDGIKNIIIPEKNRSNLSKIPKKVKKDLKFYFVKNIYETAKILF
ncbi:MAG: endopeptidase La [candidate division WOR-3 bacterium]|jgi:ATP-dependent Lon protease